MAVTSASTSVTTAATALNTAGDGGTLVIQNGATAMAIGPSTVTATTGPLLAAAAIIQIALKPGQVIYGITAASTSTVLTMQT